MQILAVFSMIPASKKCNGCHCSWQFALPAGVRDETTPFWRNQLQAMQTAWKRADSHRSGARCVRRCFGFDFIYAL